MGRGREGGSSFVVVSLVRSGVLAGRGHGAAKGLRCPETELMDDPELKDEIRDRVFESRRREVYVSPIDMARPVPGVDGLADADGKAWNTDEALVEVSFLLWKRSGWAKSIMTGAARAAGTEEVKLNRTSFTSGTDGWLTGTGSALDIGSPSRIFEFSSLIPQSPSIEPCRMISLND